MADLPPTTRELRSTLTEDGVVRLHRRTVEVPSPDPDQVVIRVGAAPINPSDLGMMFAGAPVDSLHDADGEADLPAVVHL